MYICPNCQRTYEAPGNFCAVCGAPLVEKQAPVVEQVQPVVQEPVAPVVPEPVQVAPTAPVAVVQQPFAPAPAQQVVPAPQPVQPQYQYVQYHQPVVVTPGVSKGKAIAGMILGIIGFAMSILGNLYTLIAFAESGIDAFALAFVMTMISFPLSLVGLILSKGCINAGNTSGMCSVGKNLGLVGVILSGVMLFLGFIGLVSGTGSNDYYYY